MSVQLDRRASLLVVACFISYAILSQFITTSSSDVQESSLYLLSSHHKECTHVERHPDQCAFVMNTCKGFSKVYLAFYYCSEVWRPISMTLLVTGLLMLFGAVSVAASDFFCPNLQTISAKLQLSESMAGVTVLAFGNGSTDLFSTFSAMSSGSGSLAIGELIGAAFLLVSVVSGSMGIIRPFRSKRITFMRDASFLAGAVMMLTWIVYHQRIFWYHGVALIAFYVTYVFVVVFGAFRLPGSETPAKLEYKSSATSGIDQDQLTEASRLLQHEAGKKPPRLNIPIHGFASQHSFSSHESHLGHIIRPVSSNSSYRSSLHIDGMNVPRTTSTNGSISTRLSRHAMTPRVGIRTSVFSAIEFQEQVTTIRRTGSTSSTVHRRRDTSNWGNISSRRSNQSLGLLSAASSSGAQGRTRSSTVGDRLMPTGMRHTTPTTATTPDSTHSSTGIAEDYFTYISTNQQNQNSKAAIPEIRLPTTLNKDHGTLIEDQHSPQGGEIAIRVPQLPPQPTSTSPSRPASVLGKVIPDSLFDDVLPTLFPTLQNWDEKTTFAKLSSLVAAPVVLMLTVTLPVAEDAQVDDVQVVTQEDDENGDAFSHKGRLPTTAACTDDDVVETLSVGEDMVDGSITEEKTPWCRWLLATQAILATTFIFIVMALNGFISPRYILVGTILGSMLSALVLFTTKSQEQPSWFWMVSFAGFIIALHWIFLLANEMVSLLQALGTILNISDAIMGLTIFAFGNSIGDLVANTAIAKMGFPTMAISACYAGPLLNMVLGVGISSTYQALKTGVPYKLDIAPSILVSSTGLIIVLLSTLVVVNLNGYCINKELGWWMIIVYCICCVINVLLECDVFE
ncbi:hypothetical protein LRAMOSA06936 [Lichtheimia ramosa]|uniref:Sodium/calcium exchanger membrane region domain-containing protein n=1 Tax=Lichtheimia ramosa TaxID=688394 RepID=A0A077WAD2_9FUNG|nr:hypothetical protein LRAMOSA06936 [Lichtheimia ramosa]